ncbi:MAG: glycosyltransferase family 2 protein [Bacteroidota bacterium]
MKVTGFSFIRNAIKFDYPIVEAVRSILPLCDEVVIAVGQSEDETLELVRDIDPKVRIIETVWEDEVRTSGNILAIETNKAFDAIREDTDWCFYIQGDEVLHEKYIPTVKAAMEQWLEDEQTEGLLFNYLHFYGSYDYTGDSRGWYRKEIRVIRNDKRIRSFRDAQGFKKEGEKLQVRSVDAYIHHYGWVKHPEKQQQKQLTFNKFWHDDEWMEQNVPKVEQFDYSKIDSLRRFEGTHPKVIQERIRLMNWEFSFDPTQRKLKLKERLSRWFEKGTGIRLGEYRNYKIIKN